MASNVTDQSASFEHGESPWFLGTVLFLLSTATVLFTLTIFRLLAFFIMPSLFFDLLFVGFPIGALIGVRFFQPTLRAFQKTLWILQGVMVLSIIAVFLCKQFDYLRAHLFDIHLAKLILQICAFTGLFIPFFCAYGLSEYLGYQIGRKTLSGRMRSVYAVYLFGAAFAFAMTELLLKHLGISRLLILSLLLVVFSQMLLSHGGWQRRVLLGVSALLLVCMMPPQMEAYFLNAYKFKGSDSTIGYAERGYRSVFQRWGNYFHVDVMHHPETGDYAGFYNDIHQWFFHEKYGFGERSLGMLPINWVPADGSIAIIGSGGGRQVRWASAPWFNFRRILAIEVEPTVIQAVRGPLREGFANVYESANVEVVPREARSYMEQIEERFDLIFLPSVGGYPQMMLEPGNMVRTVDAYRTLRKRLTDRGILAIWYPKALDPKGILTKQYIQTLESKELGMQVRAFATRADVLIMAARSPETPLPDLAAVEGLLVGTDPKLPFPPQRGLKANTIFSPLDIHFRPISDNQPFLAGNVRHIFALDQVYLLFGLASALVITVAGLALFLLRRTADPHVEGRSYLQFAGISFLIGANFLLFEHFAILALFRKLYMYHDAVVMGAISYLILTGLGSVLITPRWRGLCQLVGAGCVVALIFLRPYLSPGATLGLVAPVAFVTGSFFPAVFEAADRNPLIVFAMDAIGAALGSIMAFFVPIAFGFRFFFPLAAGVFLITVVATYRFFQPQKAAEPARTVFGLPLRVPWPAVVACAAAAFLGWIALGPRESNSGTGLDYALFILSLVLAVVVMSVGIVFSLPVGHRRRLAGVLACVGIVVCLAIGVWELIALKRTEANPWYLSNDVGVVASETLPFQRSPGLDWTGTARGVIAVATGEHDPYAKQVTFQTDADGFRNQNHADKADIVFVGDGITEAGNVDAEDTFVQKVGQQLGVSVRNLGRAGYGTPSEVIALEKYGLKYGPRVVVWQISEQDDLMDTFGFMTWKMTGTSPILEANRRRTLSAGWSESSPTHRLFQKVRWRPPWPLEGSFQDAEGNRHTVRFLAAPSRAQSPIKHPGARTFAEALQMGALLLRRNNVDLLVAFVPMKIRVLGPFTEFSESTMQKLPESWELPESKRLGFKLQEICQALGLRYVDTTPALRESAAAGVLVFPPLDSHLSPAGHDVVARVLSERLASKE